VECLGRSGQGRTGGGVKRVGKKKEGGRPSRFENVERRLDGGFFLISTKLGGGDVNLRNRTSRKEKLGRIGAAGRQEFKIVRKERSCGGCDGERPILR